jgi:hypothetical protein
VEEDELGLLLREGMGVTGRMSQTNPDLKAIPGRPDMIQKRFTPKRFVPQEGQRLYVDAKEAYTNYFCKFDFTGQVPQEKDKNV